MGDRHLLVFDGTSNNMVVAFKFELIEVVVVDLNEFAESRIDSSTEMLGNG